MEKNSTCSKDKLTRYYNIPPAVSPFRLLHNQSHDRITRDKLPKIYINIPYIIKIQILISVYLDWSSFVLITSRTSFSR